MGGIANIAFGNFGTYCDDTGKTVDGQDQIEAGLEKLRQVAAVARVKFGIYDAGATPLCLDDHGRRQIDADNAAETRCERFFEASDATANVERVPIGP